MRKKAAAVCSVAAMVGIVLSHGTVRTNKAGLELIGNSESCQRDPYVCPAGVLTDGLGNTKNVFSGKSDEQIAYEWERNILEAETCVNRYAEGRKLPDGAFSAATSLVFNAGCGTVRNSTMFALMRKGNVPAACDQFPRWVYSNKKVLPGLVERRNKERELCLGKR